MTPWRKLFQLQWELFMEEIFLIQLEERKSRWLRSKGISDVWVNKKRCESVVEASGEAKEEEIEVIFSFQVATLL